MGGGREGENAAISGSGAGPAKTESEEDAWLASIGFVIGSGEEDGETGGRWFLCDVDNGVPIGAGFPSREDAVAAARIADEWHEAEVRLQAEIRAEYGNRRDDG